MFASTLRTSRTSATSANLLRRSTSRRPASDPNLTVLPTDPLQSSLGLEPLFLNARDSLVIGDLVSGRILCWNRAAERLFGYTAPEAVGRPIDMLMPPAVARLHREQFAHYLRSGDAEALSGRGPLGMPALTRTGDEVRVELSLTPIETSSSPARWVLMTFRDASCERQLELRTLEAARAELARVEVESKLRRCTELWRDGTRELLAPVARARRAAARLARVAADPGEATPGRLALLAQVVEGRTDELQRSLERIADAAAIELGTFDLSAERVNLVPLVTRLVAAARTRTNSHRLNIGAPQGLTAHCDPQRIEAVVNDLIDRAIRRNPRGCWIDVDLRRPLAGTARIEVRDYGRRLTARERDRMLHPLSADRGWFVSRYIVEQHGGALDVEFPPEGGVRVVVSLPTHRGRLFA